MKTLGNVCSSYHYYQTVPQQATIQAQSFGKKGPVGPHCEHHCLLTSPLHLLDDHVKLWLPPQQSHLALFDPVLALWIQLQVE